jgi:hypothetical protein
MPGSNNQGQILLEFVRDSTRINLASWDLIN